MLRQLYVKNLALIEELRVEFSEGLNILTGETGAGKSLLLGSVNLALGQKANKDMIRHGRDSAMVELVFSDLTKEEEERLRELGVEVEEGQLILYRKIAEKKSEIRLNDRIVTLSFLRQVTEQLMDVHGQNEHQSLLREGTHLEILDAFLSPRGIMAKEAVKAAYQSFQRERARKQEFSLDERARLREMDILKYEISEIEEISPEEGEEERLEEEFRTLSHSENIVSALEEAEEALEQSEITAALKRVESAETYDSTLSDLKDSLYDLDAILSDCKRNIRSYLSRHEANPERLSELTERLDSIRRLFQKYGSSVQHLAETLEEKKARLQTLEDFSREKEKWESSVREKEEKLLEACTALREERRKTAKTLTGKIKAELLEMGFLQVDLSMAFEALSAPGENGQDSAEFLISLNPGEPLRPLREVASGGELSRIMLSIKTVMADRDRVPTLLFDEVDAGISGRTAEKVSEKLKKIAKTHQVLLITHLPQIAAKADHHYLIEKRVEKGSTRTELSCLSEEQSLMELARLLSGDRVTDAVLANARELKRLAKSGKDV